ncbi:MAG: hypothetical protein GF317_23295 [Candidatus Lokiarchaeota archaeon]|nr:hypothetical protein [Candidatus Lokiarchaeota archaeon]
MTCKDIVIKYLKDNGYDGLASNVCGCNIEDFNACDETFENCKPGYETEDETGEFSYIITTEKPMKK